MGHSTNNHADGKYLISGLPFSAFDKTEPELLRTLQGTIIRHPNVLKDSAANLLVNFFCRLFAETPAAATFPLAADLMDDFSPWQELDWFRTSGMSYRYKGEQLNLDDFYTKALEAYENDRLRTGAFMHLVAKIVRLYRTRLPGTC